jgi:hypothetical protein
VLRQLSAQETDEIRDKEREEPRGEVCEQADETREGKGRPRTVFASTLLSHQMDGCTGRADRDHLPRTPYELNDRDRLIDTINYGSTVKSQVIPLL